MRDMLNIKIYNIHREYFITVLYNWITLVRCNMAHDRSPSWTMLHINTLEKNQLWRAIIIGLDYFHCRWMTKILKIDSVNYALWNAVWTVLVDLYVMPFIHEYEPRSNNLASHVYIKYIYKGNFPLLRTQADDKVSYSAHCSCVLNERQVTFHCDWGKFHDTYTRMSIIWTTVF